MSSGCARGDGMKNRLGCLTGFGILAALLTGLIVSGLMVARGGALFSPGPLNAQAGSILGGVTSHADLSHSCSSCHPAFWTTTTMADFCVGCHVDIASQWQNPSTLHGAFQQQNPGLTCRSCHPDHQGVDAPLTSMGNVNFAHTSVGFSLAAHFRKSDRTPFTCQDCHRANFVGFDQAVCVNCHQQINTAFMQSHQSAYG